MYNRTSYSSHQSTITFYQLIIQVWEQDELSSGSEEALRHSNDSLRAPSAAEEMSTDDSGVQLNVIGRSKPKKSTHPRDTGCLPSGYIPQVSTLYYHKVIRTRVIEICPYYLVFQFLAHLRSDSIIGQFQYRFHFGVPRIGAGQPSAGQQPQLGCAMGFESFQSRRIAGRFALVPSVE